MIKIEIPGREMLEIENILFDFNGTIAVDGSIKEEIKNKLIELSSLVNIIILTADTYNTARDECEKLNLRVMTFPRDCASIHKQEMVYTLGSEKTAAVGNGFNDMEMFESCAFSVGVIEGEGMYSKLLMKSDVVTRSIEEAIDLFLIPDHIKSNLRW